MAASTPYPGPSPARAPSPPPKATASKKRTASQPMMTSAPKAKARRKTTASQERLAPKKSPEKPYFHLPRKELRKRVDERTRKSREDARPKPQERSDYDRTLGNAVRKAKKKGNDRQLGIRNEFGSNMKFMEAMTTLPTGKEVDMGELAQQCAREGLDIGHLLESAEEVDIWQKYEHGRSLWNPDNYKALGTRMFELNKWYLEACKRNETYIMLKIRDEHWGRGEDTMHVEFPELHQLCHMNSLDKSLISCYCL